MRRGGDATLLVTGSITTNVVAAADALASDGIDLSVVVISCLNPTPVPALVEALSSASLVFTIETHVIGGLGAMICEVVAEAGLPCRVRRCGASHNAELEALSAT